MKEKLVLSVTKLIRIEMTTSQAYMYFNMYMIRSVYFGCAIIKINDEQGKILIKII